MSPFLRVPRPRLHPLSLICTHSQAEAAASLLLITITIITRTHSQAEAAARVHRQAHPAPVGVVGDGK